MNVWTSILNWLKELAIRLKAKNPKFFRVLQWVCAIVAGLLTALMAIASQMAPEWLNLVPVFLNWSIVFPEWLLNGLTFGLWTWGQFLTGIIAVCGVVIGVAQLPKADVK